MRFWDSSALFSLVVRDTHTDRARLILSSDDTILSSFITPLELSSAIWRRRHANLLSPVAHRRADADFAALSQAWITIGEIDLVMDAALSVVSRHALRTGDAIQLASAVVARQQLEELEFVTFDNDLREAARAEGFAVLA